MLLVGLTGGIGAGKTTVARMLADRGAVVVDADRLARDAVAPGTPGHARILEEFGPDVAGPDGGIDRAALAARVFDDPDLRRLLESITHPFVFEGIRRTVEEHRDRDTVVVFDAALLMETGFDEACDVVVVVTAPLEERIERVAARGTPPEEARRRATAQMDEAERVRRADRVIDNGGDVRELERQVDALWRELTSRLAAPR